MLNTIQYREFPQTVRNFIESYFSQHLQKVSSQLPILHISFEELPQNYPSFINAEFIPPFKIAYYADYPNGIRWDGIIHDTTHFFQYHMNTKEYEQDREVVKTSVLTDFSLYQNNKFEKEAFKVQEEYLKSINKLSWKIQSDEFYNFEKELKDNNISYYLEGDTFIIDHKGNVNLPFLTSLPSDIVFNNQGKVYLPFLTFLPDNIVFNNQGYVNLNSFKSLPSNKYEIFKNNGVVKYNYYKNTFDPRIQEKLSWLEPPEDLTGWLVKAVKKEQFENFDKHIPTILWGVVTKTIKNYSNINRYYAYWKPTEEEALSASNYFRFSSSLVDDSMWNIFLIKQVNLSKKADFDSYKDQNSQMYRKRLNYYNENEGAEIFWSSKSAQEKRFEALLDIGDLTDKEILDVGCGYCDLLDYIEKRNIDIKKYVGVDIVSEIVKKARELHPGINIEVRDLQKEPIEENSFDYIFGSGIFAIDNLNWNQYTVDMLQKMLKSARIGVGVNFLKQQEMNRLSWAEPKFYEGYKGWLVKTIGKDNYTYYGVITNIFINEYSRLEIWAFWSSSEKEAIRHAYGVTAVNYRRYIISNSLEDFAKYFQPIRYIGFENHLQRKLSWQLKEEDKLKGTIFQDAYNNIFEVLYYIKNTNDVVYVDLRDKWYKKRVDATELLQNFKDGIFKIRYNNFNININKQSSLTQLKYNNPQTVLTLVKQYVTDKAVLKDNYLADDFSIFLFK